MKSLVITLMLSLTFIQLHAQRPGGHPGGGPETMIKREKQTLYEELPNLSEDQKMLINGIYDEFIITLKETFSQNRNNPNRESMREKMMAVKEEKDALIKDVLNEEEYEVYKSISSNRRAKSETEAKE